MEKSIFEQLEEKQKGLGHEWVHLTGERDAPPVSTLQWDGASWPRWWKHRERTRARIKEILEILK